MFLIFYRNSITRVKTTPKSKKLEISLKELHWRLKRTTWFQKCRPSVSSSRFLWNSKAKVLNTQPDWGTDLRLKVWSTFWLPKMPFFNTGLSGRNALHHAWPTMKYMVLRHYEIYGILTLGNKWLITFQNIFSVCLFQTLV